MRGLSGRVVDLNRGSFTGPEAAFYEFLSAAAVREIVAPVLLERLHGLSPGLVLDVGCGGGDLTRDLQSDTHRLVGADPSLSQLRRSRRRHSLSCVAAPAESLPFTDATFVAVVSSCSVKHWPSLTAGISECARVLAPGGVLVVVEIDGGADPGDLVRFAARTRVPPGLRRGYRSMATRSFVPLTPDPLDVAACLSAHGLEQVTQERIEQMPFFVIAGRRSSTSAP